MARNSPRLVVILYGRPGAGKTVFSRQLPNAAIVDFDRNSMFPAETIEYVSSIYEASVAIRKFSKMENIKTIVVDSFTTLSVTATSEFLARQTGEKRDAVDILFESGGRSWFEIKLAIERGVISPLLESGKNVFIIAHAKKETARKFGKEEESWIEINMSKSVQDITVVRATQILYIEDDGTSVTLHSRPIGSIQDARDSTGLLPSKLTLSRRNLPEAYLNYMTGKVRKEVK